MDSSVGLPPPPPPPPRPPPPPPPPHPGGVSLPHLSPFPPLLDLGESSAARPCKHKHDGFLHDGGDRRRPRFRYYSPGLVPFPSSASASPKPRHPRQKPLDMAGSPTGSTSTPPCTECGKRFSSWKALFGHMRCHPERQWRGINPPPHLRREPQMFLPGPTPPPPPPPSPDEQEEDDEYEVASSLLLLSRGPPRGEARGGNRCCEVSSSSVQPIRNARGWKRSPVGKHRKRWKWAEEGGGVPAVSRRHLLDLNLPPPMENNNNNNEGSSSSSGAVLDLRLGI